MATCDEIDDFTKELLQLYPSAARQDPDTVMASFEKYLKDIPDGILFKAIPAIMDDSPDFFPTVARIRKVCKTVAQYGPKNPTEAFEDPAELRIRLYWEAMEDFGRGLRGESPIYRKHHAVYDQIARSDVPASCDAPDTPVIDFLLSGLRIEENAA